MLLFQRGVLGTAAWGDEITAFMRVSTAGGANTVWLSLPLFYHQAVILIDIQIPRVSSCDVYVSAARKFWTA